MNFSNYVETFATYNQILIIQEQLWMSTVWIFIFHIGQAKINSVHDAPPVICHTAPKIQSYKKDDCLGS